MSAFEIFESIITFSTGSKALLNNCIFISSNLAPDHQTVDEFDFSRYQSQKKQSQEWVETIESEEMSFSDCAVDKEITADVIGTNDDEVETNSDDHDTEDLIMIRTHDKQLTYVTAQELYLVVLTDLLGLRELLENEFH